MDLSIIIPVYNTPPSILLSSLNTVILPERIDWEAIVVDDGSKEETATVCREYAQTHQRFCYIRQENRGVSSARNAGMAHATGKYVMFIDGDDRFNAREFPEDILRLDQDMVFFPFRIYDGSRQFVRKLFYGKAEGAVSREEVLLQACSNKLNAVYAKLFRKSMLDTHGIRFDENMINGEDAMFVLNAILASESFYYAETCIYDYIYSSDSGLGRIRKHPDKIFDNALQMYQARERFLQKIDSPEVIKTRITAKEQLIKDWFGMLIVLLNEGIVRDDLWLNAQSWMKTLSNYEINAMSAPSRIKYYILRYNYKKAGKLYGTIRAGCARRKIK